MYLIVFFNYIKLVDIMKDNLKLISITVLFVLTGLVLIFVTLKESGTGVLEKNYCDVDGKRYSLEEEIAGYQEGNSCFCRKDDFIECIPNIKDEEVAVEEVALENVDLETDGLEFESSYLRGILDDEQSAVLSPLKFTKISIEEESFVAVLEQVQLCPEQNIAPDQVGFYEKEGDLLKLYNMVRPTESETSLNCLVQLKYVFNDLDRLNDIQVAFIDDSGLLTYASMCVYNGKIYSDKDVFKGEEEKICTCEEGEITCDELSD